MIEIFSYQGWGWISFAASLGVFLGHNFWVVGGARSKKVLRIEAHVGHHFPHSESAIPPERIADFRLLSASGETVLDQGKIEGTALVAEAAHVSNGTQMTVLSLHPRAITLEEKTFTKYIQEEDALVSVTPHFLPGVTTTAQHEIYSKYAKAILTTGDDDVACRVVGQKMEIVPELNPATLRPGARLPIRVLLDGKPVAGARVSSGCDRSHAGGYIAHTRTDTQGRAQIQLSVGGYWFVRSHLIRRHLDPTVAQWESFWPSLTFRVDD